MTHVSFITMLKFKILLGFWLAAISIWAQTPVQITEHGYRFQHHINNGGQKPMRGETIRAYVNVYIGDTLLSSSRKNLGGMYKFDIPPASAILDHYPPLMDAALLMGIGDSASIYQPVDANMRNYLPKGTQDWNELRFEIALVQIISAEEKAQAEAFALARAADKKQAVQAKVQEYNSGGLKDQLVTTASGLKMLLVEKGQGRPVKENEAVQVHYFGFLTDGTSFDNSFERLQPLAFPVGVGQMIPGFDEGIMLLTHGSKAYFFIPGNLGYGDAEAAGGLIPPNAELIFYIELF